MPQFPHLENGDNSVYFAWPLSKLRATAYAEALSPESLLLGPGGDGGRALSGSREDGSPPSENEQSQRLCAPALVHPHSVEAGEAKPWTLGPGVVGSIQKGSHPPS